MTEAHLKRVGDAMALNFSVNGRRTKKGGSFWYIVCERLHPAGGFEEGPFDSFKEAEDALRRLYAREALRALREPSKEMRQAASKKCTGKVKPEFNLVKDVWQAMIDEALK